MSWPPDPTLSLPDHMTAIADDYDRAAAHEEDSERIHVQRGQECRQRARAARERAQEWRQLRDRTRAGQG